MDDERLKALWAVYYAAMELIWVVDTEMEPGMDHYDLLSRLSDRVAMAALPLAVEVTCPTETA